MRGPAERDPLRPRWQPLPRACPHAFTPARSTSCHRPRRRVSKSAVSRRFVASTQQRARLHFGGSFLCLAAPAYYMQARGSRHLQVTRSTSSATSSLSALEASPLVNDGHTMITRREVLDMTLCAHWHWLGTASNIAALNVASPQVFPVALSAHAPPSQKWFGPPPLLMYQTLFPVTLISEHAAA